MRLHGRVPPMATVGCWRGVDQTAKIGATIPMRRTSLASANLLHMEPVYRERGHKPTGGGVPLDPGSTLSRARGIPSSRRAARGGHGTETARHMEG